MSIDHESASMVVHRNDGTTEHLNEDGELHRLDGPAWIHGTEKAWYLNGRCHRDDGPAFIHADGTEEWYRHGQLDRRDGPAVIRPDGRCLWYFDGRLHRSDGPAFIDPRRGIAEYWLDGQPVDADALPSQS